MFLRFLIVGGSAAVLNIILRIIIDIYFSYVFSIINAYIIAMIYAFALNKKYVFKSKSQTIGYEFIKFTVVNIFSVIMILLMSLFLTNIFFPFISLKWYPNDLAHIISVFSTAITSYILHKLYTFNRRKLEDDEK